MKRLIAALLMLHVVPAGAHDCAASDCQRIKQEIRKIEARMRKPYTAKQGVRYDERLRELKQRRKRACR